MPKFDLSQHKQVFINDNLLVKSTVESLAADIAETWVGLNNKDEGINNSSRKSVTDLIRKLCRKEIQPGHTCWTSNSKVVSYFIKCIIGKDIGQNTVKIYKRKLDQFLNDDIILGRLNEASVPQCNLYTLNEEKYLSFIYAILNLKVEESDRHKIIERHLALYNVNKSNLNYKNYLEEVFRRKDELNISSTLIEKIMLAIPSIIENQIINFVSNVYKEYDILDTSELNNMALLSSQSKVCFQMCAKMFHTLFRKTECSHILLMIIQKYVEQIMKNISPLEYIALYPERYQKVIQHMQMGISTYNIKKLYALYNALLQEDDVEFAVMLLTHNTKWFNALYDEFV